MRTSRVALASAVGVIALGIIVLIGLVRVVISGGGDGSRPNDSTPSAAAGRSGTVQTDLTGFSAIRARSGWAVELTRGPSWQVELNYPEDREGSFDVSVSGDWLTLEADDSGASPWRWWGGRSRQLSARITMPSLTGLEVQGAGSIEFDGFQGGDLTISIAGAGNVEGRHSEFDSLDLTVGGAANVQLRGAPVIDAHVDLSGASNVELEMAGGELTGSLAGFGNLSYGGEVSDERVAVSGFGHVGQD